MMHSHIHSDIKVNKFSSAIFISFTFHLLAYKNANKRAYFSIAKFLEKKENESKTGRCERTREKEREREGGTGNPREISTRTCNGESAFLADGSDVGDEEGGAAALVK